MTISCNEVQEEIAWGSALSPEHQAHALTCKQCGKMALELTSLNSSFDRLTDVEVPAGFVDRVMQRIEAMELSWFEKLLTVRAIRIALATASTLFAFGNVLRFVIGVLIPSAA